MPLAGVLWFDWSVSSIVVLYWFENVALGVINMARLLKAAIAAGPHGTAAQGAKALLFLPFFAFHYFMFCAVHGIFVFRLFPDEAGDFPEADSLNPLQALARAIGIFATPLALPAAILALSHVISFFVNFIGGREYKQLELKRIMTMPYQRIMVLHLTIIFGGFAVTALGQPVWLLAVMVLVKIAVDLQMHRREHRGIREPTASGAVFRYRRRGPR